MGGAPPLPLGFAPQEAKKRAFFGPKKGPKTALWTPRIRRTARRGPDRGLPGRADPGAHPPQDWGPSTVRQLHAHDRRTRDRGRVRQSSSPAGPGGRTVLSGSRPPRRDPESPRAARPLTGGRSPVSPSSATPDRRVSHRRDLPGGIRGLRKFSRRVSHRRDLPGGIRGPPKIFPGGRVTPAGPPRRDPGTSENFSGGLEISRTAGTGVHSSSATLSPGCPVQSGRLSRPGRGPIGSQAERSGAHLDLARGLGRRSWALARPAPAPGGPGGLPGGPPGDPPPRRGGPGGPWGPARGPPGTPPGGPPGPGGQKVHIFLGI